MNVKRINLNFGGIPSHGYVGDFRCLEKISADMNVNIPDDYVAFLRHSNGGHPEVGSFSLGRNDANLFDVDFFYATDTPGVECVEDIYFKWKDTLGNRALPIGRDGGGNQIYLALIEGREEVWLYI